jgi:hypothetical protein
MTVAIEFDVPIDVIDEITHAIVVVFGAIERIEKPAEHLRDDVFAAVEECRQDLFRRARIGQRHRMRDKGLHVARCTDPRQGDFDQYADQHKRTELLKLARAGTDVPHGTEVLQGTSTRSVSIKEAYAVSGLTGHKQELMASVPYSGYYPVYKVDIPPQAPVRLELLFKPPLSIRDFCRAMGTVTRHHHL